MLAVYLLCILCLLVHLCMAEQYSRQPFGPNMCRELALRYGKNVSRKFDEVMLLCEIAPAEPTAIQNGTETQIPRQRTPSAAKKAMLSGYSRLTGTDMNIKYHRGRKTWLQASATCTAEGAHLVKIDSRVKYTAVKNLFNLQEVITNRMLIGLHDKFDNDTWYWLDGDRLTYQNWRPNEPDHIFRNIKEDCVLMWKKQYTEVAWDDLPCHTAYGFLCEANV